jgi:hypothetical protein
MHSASCSRWPADGCKALVITGTQHASVIRLVEKIPPALKTRPSVPRVLLPLAKVVPAYNCVSCIVNMIYKYFNKRDTGCFREADVARDDIFRGVRSICT